MSLPTRPVGVTMATTADVHPVDGMPPVRQLADFGPRHVLAMHADAVAVPLIVGGAMKPSPADLAHPITADLLVRGIAALIRCVGLRRFGARPPIMQGCTFVSPCRRSARSSRTGSRRW